MLGKFFNQKKKSEAALIHINLNAKLQPLDRAAIYEDPIDEAIYKIGSIVGGGTLQSKSGEVESCDIDIEVKDVKDIETIKQVLFKLDIPRGSKVTIHPSKETFAIGEQEGLALYLNGIDLPDEVYQTSDINFVAEQIDQLIEGKGIRYSHWEGNEETALYFYGNSFIEMKTLISEFINTYPLCEKCRVVQVA